MKSVLAFLGSVALATVLVLAVWIGFLAAFPQIGPRIGQTPMDVWAYLVDGKPAQRAQLLDGLVITLRDAGIGFAVGMSAALGGAALALLSREFERSAVPVATLLRSIPLVTLAPILVATFGRGLTMVAITGALVVFFPAFVTIMSGLRGAPRETMDLVRAYGGSETTALRMVALPAALPSLFAALRISVPGALIGALIAEWLGTGEGLGSTMLKAIPRYDYPQLWASIAVVAAASIVAYTLVGAVERVVALRFAGPSVP
ncbi:ABC transporter permease [Nocardia mangyaensis]|uniref:ABC transporter permease n=1 Tax=Nocardia mangyaensis TaxID=2213200 RepID=UPI0026765BD3|nr:ABC transporter permease subunit [Nocardia mangyaensis]MDO3648107.1 ABC transporter permease subunit [Nocardia mangyaensis]